MVEAARESREQIKTRLRAKFEQLFDTADQCELKINKENGNITVRQLHDEATGITIAFGTYERVESLVPDDFKPFFERYEEFAVEANEVL